jgi:hypothetical protein
MNTFVFQPGLTWRKAGYAFFSDSLAYREVINANPVWDITSSPPPGSILYDPTSETTQMSQSTGLMSNFGNPEDYYPFDSADEFNKSLYRYNMQSLLNVERNNGWSLTSTPVLSGIQSNI